MTVLLLISAYTAAGSGSSPQPSHHKGRVTSGNTICYTKEDSIRVVELLTEGACQPAATNMVLFYANKFLGTPYVAATLEVNPTEQLVVNLHQLDCTTFVETVTALTLTTNHGEKTWDDYCKWLTAIRYNGGLLNGYTSRNHYFSQWIKSNTQLGLCNEISQTSYPWSGKKTLKLDYMSTHTSLYPMLRDNDCEIECISNAEKHLDGKTVRYIPKSLLGQSPKILTDIHDGDIIAIVTSRKGLDTSHIGIAVWGMDRKLHLLNASRIRGRVVLEQKSLYQYMQEQKSQLGIRVVRLTQ